MKKPINYKIVHSELFLTVTICAYFDVWSYWDRVTFGFIFAGYKVEVLGISNTVYLPKPISVEVTPIMPILKLSSTLPRAPNASSLNTEDKHYQTLFTSANLYRGHR